MRHLGRWKRNNIEKNTLRKIGKDVKEMKRKKAWKYGKKGSGLENNWSKWERKTKRENESMIIIKEE